MGSSTTVILPLPSPRGPRVRPYVPQLNFYIPISQVDENMERAHRRDAVQTQRFCPRGGRLQIHPPPHQRWNAPLARGPAPTLPNRTPLFFKPPH